MSLAETATSYGYDQSAISFAWRSCSSRQHHKAEFIISASATLMLADGVGKCEGSRRAKRPVRLEAEDSSERSHQASLRELSSKSLTTQY